MVLGAEDSQEQKIENFLGLTDLVEQTEKASWRRALGAPGQRLGQKRGRT